MKDRSASKKISGKNAWVLYLLLLTFGVIQPILTVVGGKVFPDTRMYLALTLTPLFFFVCELITILLVEKNRKNNNPHQLVNLYLGLKVGKILLSLVYIGIYMALVNVELKRFVLVFVLLYFVFLLFDTLYLTNSEKKLNRKLKS